MSKKMFAVVFTFLLMTNFSYAGETKLKLTQNVGLSKLDDNEGESLQVQVITEGQRHQFSLYGYDPEVWGDKDFYFELNFDNHSVILPLKFDEEYSGLYAEVSGSELKKACDKMTKNMYLLDHNKKRVFFFPYNKFGVACKAKNH